jgi:hypothetical protein
LRHRAGEAVENETLGAIRAFDALANHADENIVGDQLAGIHHALRLEADRAARFHLGPEHVARGNLRHAITGLQ